MALDASQEIEQGAILLSLNSRHTGGKPLLMPNGEAILIDRSIQNTRQLAIYRAINELNSQGGTSVFVDGILESLAHLLANSGPAAFVSAEISTRVDWCRFELAGFGFRKRDGVTLSDIYQDPVWDSSNLTTGSLRQKLQSWFDHDLLPRMSAQRFRPLFAMAQELVAEAEHVPFGSLACAIALKLDTPITMCPNRSLDTGRREKRAIRYTRRTDVGLEEFIFYAPCLEKKSSLDFWTRFAVAHELAHVALRHPAGNSRNPQHEVEAHYLAVAFLLLHGAPHQRECPSDQELHHILDETDLSNADKASILERFKQAFSGPNTGGFVVPPAEDEETLPPDGNSSIDEIRSLVAAGLSKWHADSDFQKQIEDSINARLSKL